MLEPEEPVPVAGLQHFAYCPRQFALIHLEQAFDDNVDTLRGQAVHLEADRSGAMFRKGLRVARALPIWSDRLGLVGKADVVEFEPDGTPFPVEYKKGDRRKEQALAACDDLQLAAQAMCLEEMLGKPVPEGAIFYAASKRRRIVAIDSALRSRVEEAVAAARAMLVLGGMPPPTADSRRCRACSLRDRCQPDALRNLAANATQDPFEPGDLA